MAVFGPPFFCLHPADLPFETDKVCGRSRSCFDARSCSDGSYSAHIAAPLSNASVDLRDGREAQEPLGNRRPKCAIATLTRPTAVRARSMPMRFDAAKPQAPACAPPKRYHSPHRAAGRNKGDDRQGYNNACFHIRLLTGRFTNDGHLNATLQFRMPTKWGRESRDPLPHCSKHVGTIRRLIVA